MRVDPGAPPAFGTATLSNCEREQIHLAGSVQPYGALVVVREADRVIVQESENAASFVGLDGRLRGRSLSALGGSLAARLLNGAPIGPEGIPVAAPCTVGAGRQRFTALIHRAPGGELVVELERAGETAKLGASLEATVNDLVGATNLQSLCDEAARSSAASPATTV